MRIMKKILLVNGSYNEIPLIKAAHRLGYYVITSGNDSTGEGHKYANEYCPCDYSDKEAVYQLAKRLKVDAICACGNDFGAISAAYASEKLGLPGHDTYENSRLFHEKDMFKEMVAQLGITSPRTVSFDNKEEALRYIEGASFPQIVKPSDLGGGKGIQTVDSVEEGKNAVEKAFSASKNKRIVIEDYIKGKQQGVTVYIKDRKVVMEYSTNDFSYLNPFMVWMVYGSPAEEYSGYRDKLIADIERIAEEKRIADGFLTIQYMLKDGVPYLLETMRRCLGNMHYLCMSRDTGVDFFEWFIATEAGMDCSEYVSRVCFNKGKSGFMGVYAPCNGVVEKVIIDPQFQEKIFDVKMLNGPGYVVKDYLYDKLGMVYFSVEDSELSWFLENREKLIRVEMTEQGE